MLSPPLSISYPDHGQDQGAEEEGEIGGGRQRRQNVEPIEILQNVLVDIVIADVDLLANGDGDVEELGEGEVLPEYSATTARPAFLNKVVRRRHGGRHAPVGDGGVHF